MFRTNGYSSSLSSSWSESGACSFGTLLLNEFGGRFVVPGSGLIGQLGSDMTRISPHMPASVNGRRTSP